MNRKLLFWSVAISLGGLLFGMDVTVISGAERQIQHVWNLSDLLHGQALASALYGTIIGALFGGIPAEKYGRKKALLAIGVVFLFSALGSALVNDVYSFMAFRFLGGLGVGASSVVAPMFISEISPAKYRGRLVAFFQFNIVLGILLAYLSNYLLSPFGELAWRLMLGVLVLPALVFIVLTNFVPESPRWLIMHKKDREGARKILLVSDPEGVEDTLKAIEESNKEPVKKRGERSLRNFFSKKYRKSIFLAILIAAFNQLSGINAVLYFATRIFEMAGLADKSAFLQSIGVGFVNLVFTMLGLYLIDRMGRKKLMLIGSVGYILSLLAIAFSFFHVGEGDRLIPILLFVFIASHAIGQGTVIWVFISEIFPNKVRSYGQSLGTSVHWILAAVITGVFPFFANHPHFGPSKIFFFFAFMMVLQLVWVLVQMPETKGISLEDIKKRLLRTD